QAVAASLMSQELITPEHFSLVTARLLEWNYVNTICNARDLVQAGVHSGWDTSSTLFSRSLQMLGPTHIAIRDRMQIAIEFFRLVGAAQCPLLKLTAVVQGALNSLNHTRA